MRFGLIPTREFVDPFTLYLAFPVTVLGILAIFQIIPWRHFPSSFWHAAVLQFAGFFIARDALVGSALPPYNLLLAFALCNAIWLALADVIYGLYRSTSVHLINTVIFAQSCLVHSLLFLLRPSHGISYPHLDYYTTALQALPLIEAVKSILATLIIHQYGAASLVQRKSVFRVSRLSDCYSGIWHFYPLWATHGRTAA
ncbi:hypothetical protein L210DRAFT_2115992 [Boletus edulis BED1]|uniref:Uncharacterized protein n=1 Tax=Boletus edulis BED1 TaxID=1328754 RepID=A0AAD4GF25_BOLED|nr:hypothetical protein L210DRAFT_2115992 [Boletus edulis BED1]